MQFDRISIVDDIALLDKYKPELSNLSRATIDFSYDEKIDSQAIIGRIKDADAILVSCFTPIDAEVLDACPKLRFIGLASSAFANPASCNVDLVAAAERNILVSTLAQYGDESTAEWIMTIMLGIANHVLPLHWQEERRELFGKTIGIIGMGHMGKEVAKRAKALGMRVLYWSRNRKTEVEINGYEYLPLSEVLSQSDIVSVHVGKGTQILGPEEFAILKSKVMLINTSLGQVFAPRAFSKWLANTSGVVFSDCDVDSSLAEPMRQATNAWVSQQSAGHSYEMQERKGEQLIENLKAFLAEKPIRMAPR